MKKSKAKLGNLRNLLPYLKQYKKDIFWVIIALIITSSSVLILGKVIKYLIDFGFAQNSSHYINMTLLGFFAAIIILAIAGYFRSYLINSVGEKVVADLRNKVYAHIIKVSPEFFEISKTGDVISRLTVDTTLLYSIISNSISFALRNILLFLGGIIFLFLTSAKLTFISLAIIPLAIAPIIIMGRKIKKLSVESQEKLSLVSSHIEETINGIKTIQAYICEDKEIKNFKDHVTNSLNISLKKIRIRAFLISLVISFAFSCVAIVLWYGSHEVINSNMSSGDLSSFIFYSIITATSLVAISQVMGQLQTAAGACERLFELLAIKSPIIESENPVKLNVAKGDKIKDGQATIQFKNVSFSYPSRPEVNAISNFNLTIKPQEKIAIVGPSGSGKSTSLQLLMRFYDVSKGEIFINKINSKDLSLKDLRGLFSYISQDCFIFSGTIFDNISYANQKLTKKEVQKIIDENEALHFINKLPDKLDSFVGEKGIKLSGGERQRIAIARAIIKDSPILLLDEATSSLDNKNEESITKSIQNLMKNKTTLTIAHRLSTIINSDRIIFVKDGEIIEEGTHKELIDKCESYKNMYQAGSYS